MKFTTTRIPGAFVIDPDVFMDERGAFAITWHWEEFEAHGLDTRIAQGSAALTHTPGSIRGLHYQAPPFEEAKVIRVTKGAVFDVVVDLRVDSPAYLQWIGVELTADNRRTMYVPAGCAHGYQTLAPDTEVFYFVSARYSPPHQRGVRWNDPAIGITWPLGPPTCINTRDASYPDIAPAAAR